MSPAEHNRTSRRRPIAISTAALLLLGLTPGVLAAGAPSISISAVAQEIPLGAGVTVAGNLTGSPQATQELQLEAAPYPFRAFAVVEHTESAAAGSFTFAPTRPQENTRLRVSLTAAPATASATLQVTVDPRVALESRSLGPGRVRLSLRIEHNPAARARPGIVYWYLAARGSRTFELAATSASGELGPGVTYASTIVDPPARHFSYRACLNPAWEASMGPAATHGSCPDRGFRLPDGN